MVAPIIDSSLRSRTNSTFRFVVWSSRIAGGRKAPDRAPRLIASVIEEAERYVGDLGCEPDELAFGGRSMGGRICSMAIAEGLPAAAVVLLSYPLHPPGKPERLRIEHFPALAVPRFRQW